MSILESNKIDTIGIDKESGEVILTISDHLDWSDSLNHVEMLQEKLNSYIEFIESGQITEDYPKWIGKKLIVQIISLYDYNQEGKDFLLKVNPIMESIGVSLKQKVSK